MGLSALLLSSRVSNKQIKCASLGKIRTNKSNSYTRPGGLDLFDLFVVISVEHEFHEFEQKDQPQSHQH